MFFKAEEKPFTDRIIGAFVGINNANVSDCYSIVKGESSFAGINQGKMTSFYSCMDDVKGFDFDKNFWQKDKSKRRPLKFTPEKWHIITSSVDEDIMEITTKEQLLDFAKKVNNGDTAAIRSHVKLRSNINLKSAWWKPIGKKALPFKGIFDGNGFEIYNVHIKGGGAFFSYNSGKICNLIIDSQIYSGEKVAGFADVNNGCIECCGAIINLTNKKNKIVGGFVAENYGDISKCYSSGKMRSFFFPLWAKILPILLLFLISSVSIASIPYKQIPYDVNQVKVANASQTNENYISFEFNMAATIDLKTGMCTIDYINDGASQKDVVIEIQMTDADAYAAAGAIDKSPSELQTLMDNGGYDPKNSWTTIAKSGAVRPGNKLDKLPITKLYGGKFLPPGQYTGRAHLIYYNTENHNREVVENSFALAITVQ